MGKKNKILSCAVVFALTGFLGGVSAADVYQLDTVTVTANRYEKMNLMYRPVFRLFLKKN